MRVYVESVLPCTPEQAWDEVQKSALLLEVMFPLARLVPVDPVAFPERWQQGSPVRCKTYLFGFIPLGTRVLLFEGIDPEAREIQTREHDPLIRKWDHLIRVRPAAEGHCLYSDEIEIDAGVLTFLVWLFASWFYRHRHKRWRRVAKRLAGN
jgi:hypothetical protein